MSEVLLRQEDREKFIALFLEENAVHNLSAARTSEAVGKLVEDSLAVAGLLELREGQLLLDVGTGGGFPGLVLAQAIPGLSVTLLDAVQKKCSAVGRLATALNRTNVQVCCGRAETLAHQEDLREQFDVVVAKAVAALPTLLELTVPFLAREGVLVAYKGPRYEEELLQSRTAQSELGVELTEVHAYTLGQETEPRSLLFFRRTGSLSDRYPRRDGLPKKSPLL